MKKEDYEKKIDFEYLSGGKLRQLVDEKLSIIGMPVRLSGDDVDILRRAVEWFEYTAKKRLNQKNSGSENIIKAHQNRQLKADKKSIANREAVRRHRLKNKS